MQTVPLWLWFNLLSLDAVAVAVGWQLVFARSFHVHVPAVATTILGLCVWLIYAADRLLDARAGADATPRHRFYRRYARRIMPLLAIGATLAAVLVLSKLDAGILNAGVQMAFVMIVYFTITHAAPRSWAAWWPKELTVAILFALGTCLPVYAEAPETVPAILAPIAIYAWLIWMNAIGIDRWEHGRLTSWMAPLALGACFVSILLAFLTGRIFLYGAAALAGFGLAILAHERRRLSRISLPFFADAALAIPAFAVLAIWFAS